MVAIGTRAPQFVDPDQGNLYLKPNSPAITPEKYGGCIGAPSEEGK
ncbi:MAG: hypothetical protein AAFZ15_05455 [Bacteroidota bacterium]